MNSLIKFIEEYEAMKVLYPEIYLSINESRKGNFWRIKVCAYEMAIIGDAELMNAEAETREEAFDIATKKLKEIPSMIFSLVENKRKGRKVYVKRDNKAAAV